MVIVEKCDWRRPQRPIILASQSPRRKDILTMMGLTFCTISPRIANEEEYFNSGVFEESLQCLSVAKANSIAQVQPDALVLGADTVVVLGTTLLGKPKNKAHAYEMIVLLSGKVHIVYTGIALVCKEDGFCTSKIAKTSVTFRDIAQCELEEYCDHGDWQDKAGGYAIQGMASVFIDKIEGCYYNVVGLPIRATIDCFAAYTSRKDTAHV